MPGPKTAETAPAGHICCWLCLRYRAPEDLDLNTRRCTVDCTTIGARRKAGRPKLPKRVRTALGQMGDTAA